MEYFSFNEIFSHGHLLMPIRNHHCGIFVFRYNNNNNKRSGQIFLILPFLYCWTLSLENKLNIPHLSAKPNKVLPLWVYHNRNLSFHAWDTQVCNNFGISEDSYYSLLYLLTMIWWGQIIHAIQKEFWKQKSFVFFECATIPWNLFEAHVSACIHKV